MPELPGPRHGVERPHVLAGARIPGAHVAGRAALRKFLRGRARDHEIPIDQRRRGQSVLGSRRVCGGRRRRDVRRLEIDDAARDRSRSPAPDLRIERDEAAVARSEEDSRRVLGIAGPVLDAAQRRLPGPGTSYAQTSRPVSGSSATTRRYGVLRYISPSTTSGVACEAPKRLRPLAGGRHSPSCALRGSGCEGVEGRSRPHAIGPRDLQTRDIGSIDLRERRVAHAARIVAVRRPLGGRVAQPPRKRATAQGARRQRAPAQKLRGRTSRSTTSC